MVTVLSGTLFRKGTVIFLLKNSVPRPSPPHISLHDLVTPPLGLFLLASRKSQAGRAGDQGGRRAGKRAEPITWSARCKAISGASW